MKQLAFFLVLSFCGLSFSHPTGFQSYVSFKGSKQGQLKGETKGKGGREREGWFVLQAFSMGTQAPVDTRNAGSKGKSHGSVTITREIDGASPLLFQALSTNELLNEVVIQNVDDQNKPTKTITLTNATISDLMKNGNIESLLLTYDTIIQ